MRYRIILSAVVAVLLASCVGDNGNYDYNDPEVPMVTLNDKDDPYPATVGEVFTLTPPVTFSDPSRLEFLYQIIDTDNMTSHDYEGQTLQFFYTLKPEIYNVRLTVTDTGNAMKYFYEFAIAGETEFSNGYFFLTSVDGGKSNLTFMDPEGNFTDDVYGVMNGGAQLPDGPKQLITLYHEGYGNILRWVWVICSDTDRGGVKIDPTNMTRLADLRDNFYSISDRPVNAGMFYANTSNATMYGIESGKFYVGEFATYYAVSIYGFFGIPTVGIPQNLAPVFASANTAFAWCYDMGAKAPALVLYASPGGQAFTIGFNGPPNMAPTAADYAFDEVYTMLMAPSGMSCIVGRGADGKIYAFNYSSGGPGINPGFSRTEFPNQGVTAASKWGITATGAIYFTAGSKVYRYNSDQSATEMTAAVIEGGDITMLKVLNPNMLAVGTDGHLYRLNVTAGQNGAILSTISGFRGQLMDYYSRDND